MKLSDEKGCRASPIKAEVTTGEAEPLVRRLWDDGHLTINEYYVLEAQARDEAESVNLILHNLRNPHGRDSNQMRADRLSAAEVIESLARERDRLSKRCTALTDLCVSYKRKNYAASRGQRAAQSANASLRAKLAEARGMLLWLDSKGGLELDVHKWIKESLDKSNPDARQSAQAASQPSLHERMRDAGYDVKANLHKPRDDE